MSGSRAAGPWLALLASVLFACAGCSREPKPLEPPDPAAHAVELAWNGYRTDEKASGRGVRRLLLAWEYRLTMTPDGRFRYAWRSTDDPPGSWKAIAGSWRARLGGWTLEPDLGGASLEAGQEGEIPEVSWGPISMVAGTPVELTSRDLARASKSRGPEYYVIPGLDEGTGRILKDGVTIVPDPRLGVKYPDGKVIDVLEDE